MTANPSLGALDRHHGHDHEPSVRGDRDFGLVMAAAAAVLFGIRYARGQAPGLLLPVLAVVFLITALGAPRVLRPLNLLWRRVGLLLERVTAPLVAAIIYYVVLTPTAVLLRLRGRETIDLRFEAAAESYWTPRTRARASGESLKRQF